MIRKYSSLLPSYLRGNNVSTHSDNIFTQDKIIDLKNKFLSLWSSLEFPILIQKIQTEPNTATFNIYCKSFESPIKTILVDGDYDYEISFERDAMITNYTIENIEITNSENYFVNAELNVTLETYDGYLLKKNYPENDKIVNNNNDHFFMLDVVGALIGIPRRLYNSYSIQDARRSTPSWFGKKIINTEIVKECSEDDYYYLERVKYFVEHLFDTPMALLLLKVIYEQEDVELVVITPELASTFSADILPEYYDAVTGYDMNELQGITLFIDSHTTSPSNIASPPFDTELSFDQFIYKYIPITRKWYLYHKHNYLVYLPDFAGTAVYSSQLLESEGVLYTSESSGERIFVPNTTVNINFYGNNVNVNTSVVSSSYGGNFIIENDYSHLTNYVTITIPETPVYTRFNWQLAFNLIFDWYNPDSFYFAPPLNIEVPTEVPDTPIAPEEISETLNVGEGLMCKLRNCYPYMELGVIRLEISSAADRNVIGLGDADYYLPNDIHHGYCQDFEGMLVALEDIDFDENETHDVEIQFYENKAYFVVDGIYTDVHHDFTNWDKVYLFLLGTSDAGYIVNSLEMSDDVELNPAILLNVDWYNPNYWINEGTIDNINKRVSTNGGDIAYFNQYSLDDLSGVQYTVNHNNRDGRQWIGFYNPTTDKWLGHNWTHDPCTLENTATGTSIDVSTICSNNNIRNTASRNTKFIKNENTLTYIINGVTIGNINLGGLDLSGYYIAQYDQRGFGHSLQNFKIF